MDSSKSKGSTASFHLNSLIDLPDLPPSLTIDKYVSGRAEALGALCRIICAKKTGEEILSVYLARFYLALQQGLKISADRDCGESMVSILVNSQNLFRLDLDGARVLVPAFVSALEIVLTDRDSKLSLNVSKIELRRASINLLLSLLVLPLHFQNITIKELNTVASKFVIVGNSFNSDKILIIILGSMEQSVTFAQLKPRLMNLVMNALQVETDPQNTHMLLGSLFLCVQDSAAFEAVEQVTQPMTETTTTNLLSSGECNIL